MRRMPSQQMHLPERAWINGLSVASAATFDVTNPATDELIAKAPDCTDEHFQSAIKAASAAFATWRHTSGQERSDKLLNWAGAIENCRGELETLLTRESGKVLKESGHEVSAALAAIRWAASRALVDTKHIVSSSTKKKHHYTVKQPIGVVACITPWNFPVAAVVVKASAALAAGCAVVIKPSEETPLVALSLAQLSKQAGLPDGLFNVVPTSQPVLFGNAVTENKCVRAVSFTGSTIVGKQLYAACAGQVKRVALELGGNAPFLVFDDADIEQAVNGAIAARFYNTGQICVGANRFYIHDAVYEEFRNRLCERVATLHTGDGMHSSSDLGPLINQGAKHRLNALMKDAISKGANVLVGESEQALNRSFVNPVVMENISASMDVYNQEIFGPIACIGSFNDYHSVIKQANNTDAGLVAYAYSGSSDTLKKLAIVLEAGVVGLNSTQVFASDLPFGGIKESGIGREHGVDCLDEFMEIKSVVTEQEEQG